MLLCSHQPTTSTKTGRGRGRPKKRKTHTEENITIPAMDEGSQPEPGPSWSTPGESWAMPAPSWATPMVTPVKEDYSYSLDSPSAAPSSPTSFVRNELIHLKFLKYVIVTFTGECGIKDWQINFFNVSYEMTCLWYIYHP